MADIAARVWVKKERQQGNRGVDGGILVETFVGIEAESSCRAWDIEFRRVEAESGVARRWREKMGRKGKEEDVKMGGRWWEFW